MDAYRNDEVGHFVQCTLVTGCIESHWYHVIVLEHVGDSDHRSGDGISVSKFRIFRQVADTVAAAKFYTSS